MFLIDASKPNIEEKKTNQSFNSKLYIFFFRDCLWEGLWEAYKIKPVKFKT